MECVAFHFLIILVGRHFMAIFQDDNARIHQAQIGKEWLGGIMKKHFHSWMSPDLKFIENLWDVLEETLQSVDSCIVNNWSNNFPI